MAEPLIFIDVSEVLDGKLEDVKLGFKELSAFVDANEPRALSYNVFFDEPDRTVTVVQVHPDSESMEFHMTAGAELFKGFKGLLQMQTMDIYGRPSENLLRLMTDKAAMLDARSVRVHDLHAGFTRPAGG
jgi:hypothetical protein